MTSQNIALWALINTQSKGGYSNRKKGRYRKLITIIFDWIGIFWGGFQQNNSLKAFYQHPENQEYFKNLYICPLRYPNIYGKYANCSYTISGRLHMYNAFFFSNLSYLP